MVVRSCCITQGAQPGKTSFYVTLELWSMRLQLYSCLALLEFLIRLVNKKCTRIHKCLSLISLGGLRDTFFEWFTLVLPVHEGRVECKKVLPISAHKVLRLLKMRVVILNMFSVVYLSSQFVSEHCSESWMTRLMPKGYQQFMEEDVSSLHFLFLDILRQYFCPCATRLSENKQSILQTIGIYIRYFILCQFSTKQEVDFFHH